MKRKPKKISRGGQPVRLKKRVRRTHKGEHTYWQLLWLENGKPCSASRSTAEAANALAEEIAARLAKGQMRQRTLTGLELADYEQALDICAESGASLLEAIRFHSAEWLKRRVKDISVHDLVQEFLASKADHGCSKLYLADCRLRLDKFAKAFPGSIQSVTPNDLDDFMRGHNITIRSHRNVHAILGSLFSYARASGYLPLSERTAAEILPRPRIKSAAIGILTPNEFAAVLNMATRKTLPAFVLGGFCGMRQAEICRLDWSAIDFKRGLITINADTSKRSRPRLVPLHPAAAAWLAPVAKKSGRVIEYSSPINLSIQMRPVWKAAGAKNTQNFLRSSAASYRLAATGDAPQTALELDMSIEMLMRHSLWLVTKEDSESWYSIFPPEAGEDESSTDVKNE